MPGTDTSARRRKPASGTGAGGARDSQAAAAAPAKPAAPKWPFVALLLAGLGLVLWDSLVGRLPETLKARALAAHAALSLAAVLGLVPPLSQPLAYHNFADRRRMCAVPNCCDVMSNVPFLAVGLAGLASLHGPGADALVFWHEWERDGWTVFFAGVAAVSAGSAYYHWHPTNPTLVWDRLPMSVSFMALFGLMLEERIGAAHGLFLPLVAAGVLTVVYWSATDDLRPYLYVQFYPMLAIPAIYFLFPSRYTRGGDVFLTLAWYVFAKVTEAKDREVFALTRGVVSGHTVKHLTAAAGLVHLHLMLLRRQAVAGAAE